MNHVKNLETVVKENQLRSDNPIEQVMVGPDGKKTIAIYDIK